jgi:transcriptional regulator with XRE-family HTH domain
MFDSFSGVKTYGQMIRDARRAMRPRMRQQDLADRLGVTMATISRWENDRNPPPRGQLQDLINVLSLQRDEFVKATGVPTVSTPEGKVRDGLIRLLVHAGDDYQRALEELLQLGMGNGGAHR